MKMVGQIQGLAEIANGRWAQLSAALAAGLPVPAGFVATSACPENAIRNAYEELKIQEHTHYVAVRGPLHAMIEVIGNDRVVHAMRALWSESADGEILVQVMVNSSWCGQAKWEEKNLRIRASAGLRCLDPDDYLLDTTTGECIERHLQQRPRKVFRGVAGTTRTMEVQGQRSGLEAAEIAEIAWLAERAGSSITWALDERGVWLLSVGS